MIIKLDLAIVDPEEIQNNLERPCCNGKQMHECHTHFLTGNLKNQLRDGIASDTQGTVAQVIAELAKFDSCRSFMMDDVVIHSLVKNLSAQNSLLLTQSCRALANLCYDFGKPTTYASYYL